MQHRQRLTDEQLPAGNDDTAGLSGGVSVASRKVQPMPAESTVARFSGEYAGVPDHIREGLVGYVERRWRPGGFLEAVLSNDLKEAFGRADDRSRAGLFDIVKWLYNEAPSTCWGTPDRVREWLAGDA